MAKRSSKSKKASRKRRKAPIRVHEQAKTTDDRPVGELVSQLEDADTQDNKASIDALVSALGDDSGERKKAPGDEGPGAGEVEGSETGSHNAGDPDESAELHGGSESQVDDDASVGSSQDVQASTESGEFDELPVESSGELDETRELSDASDENRADAHEASDDDSSDEGNDGNSSESSVPGEENSDSGEDAEATEKDSADTKGLEASDASENADATASDDSADTKDVEGAGASEDADAAASDDSADTKDVEGSDASEDADDPEKKTEIALVSELPIDPDDNLKDVEGEASPRLVSIIESLLFAASQPMTVKKLRKVLKEPTKNQVRLALRHIMEASRERGIILSQVAGGFQLRTHPQNAQWVQAMLQAKPVRLTRPQLEALAIVAYRQPVTRPEVEDVRGVDSGAVLKVLLERELVQIVGKREDPGRPLLYGTTLHFLEFFNLQSLRDLPTLRDFSELSDHTKATLRNKLGESEAEALGQEVMGFAKRLADEKDEDTTVEAEAAESGEDVDTGADRRHDEGENNGVDELNREVANGDDPGDMSDTDEGAGDVEDDALGETESTDESTDTAGEEADEESQTVGADDKLPEEHDGPDVNEEEADASNEDRDDVSNEEEADASAEGEDSAEDDDKADEEGPDEGEAATENADAHEEESGLGKEGDSDEQDSDDSDTGDDEVEDPDEDSDEYEGSEGDEDSDSDDSDEYEDSEGDEDSDSDDSDEYEDSEESVSDDGSAEDSDSDSDEGSAENSEEYSDEGSAGDSDEEGSDEESSDEADSGEADEEVGVSESDTDAAEDDESDSDAPTDLDEERVVESDVAESDIDERELASDHVGEHSNVGAGPGAENRSDIDTDPHKKIVHTLDDVAAEAAVTDGDAVSDIAEEQDGDA